MSAENGKLEIESGQDFTPMEQLTDLGDRTVFDMTGSLLSRASNTDITVLLDGLLTGAVITPDAGVDDSVAVTSANYQLGGLIVSASSDIVAVARPTLTHIIYSITLDGTGTYAAIAGTEGGSFVEVRGDAGGPPLIPVDEIEIGQVRLDSSSSAPVSTTEIKQVTGQHVERADSPLFNVNATAGEVELNAPLPQIHVGDTTRSIYAEYFTPIFAEINNASDFVPAEISDSSTSTQVYSNTVASVSSTLNQGSFSALLDDGVNDSVVLLKGQTLWFKMFPDRFKSASILTQGKLAIARTFPADDNLSAACTVTASEESTEEV